MYERILVPLDGSKVGETAIPLVAELVSMKSPKIKVEVTLFRVISLLTHYVVAGEASVPIAYTEKELELIEKQALDYLDKTGEDLRKRGAVVKTKVSTGNAAEQIIKACEEINADLVAMSTHGRSGFSRIAFGSVTDKVLRGGSVPVLMVRAPKEATEA